jgi:hypothetical protein
MADNEATLQSLPLKQEKKKSWRSENTDNVPM